MAGIYGAQIQKYTATAAMIMPLFLLFFNITCLKILLGFCYLFLIA